MQTEFDFDVKTVKLEVYDGPLDMLITLIRNEKIDIFDIPIAEITEKYLNYLTMMEVYNLEIAAEWLIMAATLMEIKSKMLLPKPIPELASEEEGEDPRQKLVERLLEYEKYKNAAELFKDMEAETAKLFFRGAAKLDIDLRPKIELGDVTAADLYDALNKILQGVDEPEVTVIKRARLSMKIRIREIMRQVDESEKLMFEDLFVEDRTREQVVMTFLALLELLKRQKIRIRQKHSFSPMVITKKQ